MLNVNFSELGEDCSDGYNLKDREYTPHLSLVSAYHKLCTGAAHCPHGRGDPWRDTMIQAMGHIEAINS